MKPEQSRCTQAQKENVPEQGPGKERAGARSWEEGASRRKLAGQGGQGARGGPAHLLWGCRGSQLWGQTQGVSACEQRLGQVTLSPCSAL